MVNGTNTSYVALDARGEVLQSSGNIDTRQDPASTTKLWTLYTVMAMVRDGHLPASFIETHQNDLQQMMIYSNNQASERIAVAADRASGGDGQVSNGGLDAVPGFAQWMNRYASGDLTEGRIPLNDTNFVTVSGMPHENHYSTAHDMARMMLRFRSDFEGSNVEEFRGLAGLSGSTVRAGNGTELSKTGTARGHHGSRGKYSFVGATDDGVYAIAGAATKNDRARLTRRLANRTHDSEVAFDEIDLVNPDTFLRESERESLEDAERNELAAERRRTADQHNEFSDPDAIQNGIFGMIIGFILQLFGFEQNETRNTGTETNAMANSDIAGRELGDALIASGVLNSQLTQNLRTDGVSIDELQEAVNALQALEINLTDIDLSAGLDFNNDNVVNARDVQKLAQQLTARTA